MAAKVIAVANHKGGVGKTTTVQMIADYFTRFAEMKILLIDLDPQANLSSLHLQFEEAELNGKPTRMPPIHPGFDPDDPEWGKAHPSYPITGRWSITEAFLYEFTDPHSTRNERIDIIPSPGAGLDMLLLALEKAGPVAAAQAIPRLHTTLSHMELYDDYDLILIDTPPQTSVLTRAALHTATHLLIPTTMSDKSLEGMATMLSMARSQALIREHQSRPTLEALGILPTIYNKNRAFQRNTLEELMDEASGLEGLVLTPPMRDLSVFANLTNEDITPSSPFELPENSPAHQEARILCLGIEKRLGLQTAH